MTPSDSEFQETVLEWLAEPAAELNTLVQWLQGYDPSLSDDEEPHLAILMALPMGARRVAPETELAVRAALLIDQDPEAVAKGQPWPGKFLYNLFKLCAGLACRGELGPSLLGFFKRMTTRDSLTGGWSGISLRACLCAAIAENQLDDGMWPYWRKMLEGHPDELLPGDQYDGFDGVLLMPTSKETLGDPHMIALGSALRRMAGYLDPRTDGRARMRSLLSRIEEAYPGESDWSEQFVKLAHEHAWPTWAVDCITRFVINTKDGRIVWVGPMGPALKSICPDEVTGDYCDSRFLRFRDSDYARSNPLWWVATFAAEIGSTVADLPDISDREFLGHTIHLMTAYERRVGAGSTLGHLLRDCRKELLDSQPVTYFVFSRAA